MKITLREEVFNILHKSDIAMTVDQIRLKLVENSKSKGNAISQSILSLKSIDGCDILTFKRDNLDCHVMTSTEDYLTLKPIGTPQMVIRIMADKPYYQTITQMYDKAVAMGCKLDRRKFGHSVFTVSKYNECKIESKGKGHNKLYKMVSEPVRPYTKHWEEKKQARAAVVDIEDDHCKSSVNLLFAGMAKDAAIQNKRMVNDWMV